MAPTLESPKRLDSLSAVNFMLTKYGQQPVSRLKATSDAVEAETLLTTTSISIQSEGWNFCTDSDRSFLPDSSGNINLPADIIEVIPAAGERYRIIDGKLFNRDKRTYVFDRPVVLEVIQALPFEELPQAARWYITLAATASFITSKKPDDPALRALNEALARAEVALEQSDARIRGANLVGTSPHFNRHRRKR